MLHNLYVTVENYINGIQVVLDNGMLFTEPGCSSRTEIAY